MLRIAIFDDTHQAHDIFRMLLPDEVAVRSYYHPILDEYVISDILAFGPNLIVVDLLLGETRMDGYHLIRELTSTTGLHGVPIVVWSKLINSSERGQAIAHESLGLPGVVAALGKMQIRSADDFLRYVREGS